MGRRRVYDRESLKELADVYRRHVAAESKLRRAILKAHEAGSSLRAIAEVVRMSPESVRTIVQQVKRERDRDLAEAARREGFGFSLDAKEASEARVRAIHRKWGLPVQKSDMDLVRARLEAKERGEPNA
jgi:enoyl-CoA hydratase/carnithine racemase